MSSITTLQQIHGLELGVHERLDGPGGSIEDAEAHQHLPTSSVAESPIDNDSRPSNYQSKLNGWTVVSAATATFFVGVGYTNTFGVFQVYYQTKLFPQEPSDKIILIGSIAASLYFILGALTGRFTDLVGQRLSLSIGSSLMIEAMFAASASNEYWQLFLTQGLIFGLGLAFVYPTVTTISRQYFPQEMHGRINGIVVSGGALGGCVLPYGFRELLASYSLAATFRILGYIALVLLLPSTTILASKRISTQSGGRLLDLRLLRDGRFISLATACTVAMTGFIPRYFLVTSTAIPKGIGDTYAFWLLGIMNGFSIVGRVGVGYLADRIGPLKALSATFLLCALGHYAFWLPGVATRLENEAVPTALFTMSVVYIGVFGSGFISLFPVVVADMFGQDQLASKSGLLNTAVGLSTFAGPSGIYAIIGNGTRRRWTIGVLVAGTFMLFGGLILNTTSILISKAKGRRRRASFGRHLHASESDSLPNQA